MTVAHWDEVEPRHSAKGEMDATWQRLGNAAGTRGVGVNRVRVAPGKLPTPPHSHGASEELFFVLAGSGLAWQDGDVHDVRPLDCVIHRPNEMEHTFVAGPDGLEYLVYGTRHPTEFGWLPRSRAVRIGWPWIEGRDDDPWDIEAAGEPLAYGEPAPRPPNIVSVDEAEHDSGDGRTEALLPRRLRRREDAGLRHAGAERHLLVPALEENLLAGRRRDRPDRGARILRRRAARGGLMAYDEELADRIRTLLGDRAGLTEQKMFGGLAR